MANTRKSVRPKAGASEKVIIPQLHDNKEAELPDNLLLEDAECTEEGETDADVSYTPTAEEIAAVLSFIKSQTVSETLKDNTDYALNVADAMLGVLPVEKSTKELFVKVYDVVDTITGTSIRPEDNGALTLSGRVTDADLDAAGVDKAWLLRIGAIVDAGYAGG